ncbi:hypothetical protein [Xenorhabdus sp. PB62.4]|uniref:hypothetical protein n=1 Tax=Xenorhabdus sp. PB62.4 TaxID=1851573 RepID=UPI001657086E|nr:hypothetical protein [Xenorhabdus sp. PB62.4]MBC8952598.1 hypothetical protein [Xenorhabdus sp. PB62.4]
MRNDVIELAREMKKRSEAVLLAESEFMKSNDTEVIKRYFREVNNLDLMIYPKNIIQLCDAVEKLAEYENMEPVAWGRNTGMSRTLESTTKSERVSQWREFNEAHPDIADDIFPLYRHLNK